MNSRKIIEYKIGCANTISELTEIVDRLIAEGFEPLHMLK